MWEWYEILVVCLASILVFLVITVPALYKIGVILNLIADKTTEKPHRNDTE